MSTQHQSLTSKVFDLFQYEKVLQNSTIGFLLLLQLKNERRGSLIYTRGAHVLLKEGAPSGDQRVAKWGEWAATSPYSNYKCQSTFRWRRGRHFPYPWAATSRGRHLSKRGAPPKAHKLNLNVISHQSNLNHMDVVSFDLLIDFAINSSPNLSPFILFLFSLGWFYWIKMHFFGFWG